MANLVTSLTARRTILLSATIITAGLIASQSTLALALLALEGVKALLVVASATLGGMWIAAVLPGGRMPLRWHILLGAGFGLGGLALLVMVLGLVGWLDGWLWWTLLGLFLVFGLVRLRTVRRRSSSATLETESPSHRPLWLVLCPFVALCVLVAVIPPGFLWAAEGGGYDVLEYHLGMPKEYFVAGRIEYAAHNVYANFPANVEMLYLLSFVLQGDVLDGTLAAKLLNVAFGALFVAAAWLAGRESSPAAGTVAGVVAGGIGYVTYLCGVAFVENGMLLFGMLATAAVVRALRVNGDRVTVVRWLAAAGVLAGLSAGCKYPAVVLVALPLGVGIAAWFCRVPGLRTRGAAAFGVGVLVSFSPWLVKNLAMTGNPVFPLANSVFHAAPPAWGPVESRRFDEGHAPAPEERSLPGRLGMLWARVLADPDQRFGPLVFVLAMIALIGWRRGPDDWVWVVVLGVQVAVWLFATHLYTRFALPFLLPLLVLAGRSVAVVGGGMPRRLLLGLIVLGTAFNLFFMGRLYARHLYPNGSKVSLEGATESFARELGMVGELPDSARLLLVGDAKAFYYECAVDYCVVFNRSPFVEAVRGASSAAEVIDWLQRRGYTHVLVDWAEIARLRRSRYGFPEEITPELFTELTYAGLVHDRSITAPGRRHPHASLFRVPQ